MDAPSRPDGGARLEDARALLAEVLGAADRDHCPGARASVALRDEDEPRYAAFLRRNARGVTRLTRFGRDLLSVVELDATALERTGVASALEKAPSNLAARSKILAQRWRDARPIVLPGFAAALIAREDDAIAELSRTLRRLRRPGALRRWLGAHLDEPALEPAPSLDDPERDLERFLVDDGRPGPRLWAKSATLTSPTTNASGRIRLSFGAEGDDDASADEAAHARVATLARRVLPLADALARSRKLQVLLTAQIGAPALLTQHIAYWNAPGGGALMHHDAFDEPARTRQCGVCYLQASGATVWLAIATPDLARHVEEFLEELARGEAPWIKEDHFGGEPSFSRVLRQARRREWLERELTAPGCGAFATLLNYAPEFLGILIDAGHAWRLEPGDAILLPNHGYERTALHAVWCAGNKAGLGLSMAIRRAR